MGSDLHHGGGQVGGGKDGFQLGQGGGAGEYVGTAVLAAEHRPLGEGGKTGQGCGTTGADYSVGQHPVVKGDVHAVVVPVKGHGLHIHVGISSWALRTRTFPAVSRVC